MMFRLALLLACLVVASHAALRGHRRDVVANPWQQEEEGGCQLDGGCGEEEAPPVLFSSSEEQQAEEKEYIRILAEQVASYEQLQGQQQDGGEQKLPQGRGGAGKQQQQQEQPPVVSLPSGYTYAYFSSFSADENNPLSVNFKPAQTVGTSTTPDVSSRPLVTKVALDAYLAKVTADMPKTPPPPPAVVASSSSSGTTTLITSCPSITPPSTDCSGCANGKSCGRSSRNRCRCNGSCCYNLNGGSLSAECTNIAYYGVYFACPPFNGWWTGGTCAWIWLFNPSGCTGCLSGTACLRNQLARANVSLTGMSYLNIPSIGLTDVIQMSFSPLTSFASYSVTLFSYFPQAWLLQPNGCYFSNNWLPFLSSGFRGLSVNVNAFTARMTFNFFSRAISTC